jgi:hypothetical protein
VACTAKTGAAPDEVNLAGNWIGESICQVKDSACHDEKVIYRVTEPDAAGKLTIDADKIVNGQPQDMGVLDCTYERAGQKITCEISNGIWEFTVKGNEMTGTLKLKDKDKTLFRKISVKKES